MEDWKRMYEVVVGAVYEARAWNPSSSKSVEEILEQALVDLMHVPPVEGWDE